MPRLLLFFFQILPIAAFAQLGCPDPQATNFDPSVTMNDGSCVYPTTVLQPTKRANLPTILNETSGLVFAAGKCWTHNDSGNATELFQIDTATGEVTQTIHFQGLTTADWEDVATDGQRIFIGDFGNNEAGNRTDLAVFALDLSIVGSQPNDTILASEIQKISFAWPDQTDFSAQPANSTAFDCEAFFWKNGRLHLFSKNWLTLTTTHYSLNPTDGFCEKIEDFPSPSGLITAADCSLDGKTIALLGYNLTNFTCFIWLLSDFAGDHFFSGNRRKIELGSVVTLGQMEGFGFAGAGLRGFFSNEKLSQFITIPPQIWVADFSKFFQNPMVEVEATASNFEGIAFPNPFSQQLDFQQFNSKDELRLSLKNALGQLVFESKTGNGFWETAGLAAGFYTFEASDGGRVFYRKRVVKN